MELHGIEIVDGLVASVLGRLTNTNTKLLSKFLDCWKIYVERECDRLLLRELAESGYVARATINQRLAAMRKLGSDLTQGFVNG